MKPPRRSDCPTNYAVEHFGDRWTLLLIRDLLFHGKSYYQEFLSDEEGISTNILAARLKKMEADGLILRQKARDGRRIRYVLTDKGIDLARIMVEINRWSAKYDPDTGVPADHSQKIKDDFEGLITDYQRNAVARRAASAD
ncbi:MAG: helix-turn-helix domain-containing protein [Pseudoruegeria sp.]